MSGNWKDTLTDQLCDAFLTLKTQEEVYDFLEDVATISELKALSQRLEVARLLKESKTYPQIAQQTGASTATISRVKKCLDYGTGGYNVVPSPRPFGCAGGLQPEEASPKRRFRVHAVHDGDQRAPRTGGPDKGGRFRGRTSCVRWMQWG